MARHAIIENETKKVVNCVVWDGAEWLPPRNHLVVESETANIGDVYDENAKTFHKPE
jgi:hypothetical protein